MATTRRFEDTYYSVLEKLGTLQNTIVALKELAGLSREMNLAFTTEAEELVTDVDGLSHVFVLESGILQSGISKVERLIMCIVHRN